jgi:hypothetical protein
VRQKSRDRAQCDGIFKFLGKNIGEPIRRKKGFPAGKKKILKQGKM